MKIAVIIKHPFRDFDWRVDIFDLPEETPYGEIKKYVESQMLGPFEVMGITSRINFNREYKTQDDEITN